MKITGTGRSHLTKRSRAVLVLFVLLFLAFSTSSALCASGEGGTKGWVSTDTFRVMNFAVLVVALIFVLRKPLSQALSSRIKTIKEQLDDLEAQKADAEKQLAQADVDLEQRHFVGKQLCFPAGQQVGQPGDALAVGNGVVKGIVAGWPIVQTIHVFHHFPLPGIVHVRFVDLLQLFFKFPMNFKSFTYELVLLLVF